MGLLALVVCAVLTFFTLVNTVSTNWMSYGQMLLAAVAVGLAAAVWTILSIHASAQSPEAGLFCCIDAHRDHYNRLWLFDPRHRIDRQTN